MLKKEMIGGSFGFSEFLKKKKKKKKKKTKKTKKTKKKNKEKEDPSELGYPSDTTNLNIIMKGSDGKLYKNKKYKKTKRWVRVK